MKLDVAKPGEHKAQTCLLSPVLIHPLGDRRGRGLRAGPKSRRALQLSQVMIIRPATSRVTVPRVTHGEGQKARVHAVRVTTPGQSCCRPRNALPSVTSSAYSRSDPTGRPL